MPPLTFPRDSLRDGPNEHGYTVGVMVMREQVCGDHHSHRDGPKPTLTLPEIGLSLVTPRREA